MPGQLRSVRQLAEMIKDPQRILADRKYWHEPLCHRWLYHVAVKALFDPAEAIPLAITGVRLALRITRRQERRGIRTRCALTRAYGVLGSTYRAAGKLHKASTTLAKASRNARYCPNLDVQSEIIVRRALLKASLSQRPDGSFDPGGLQDAIALAERALSIARGPLAKARARKERGMLLLYSGDSRSAALEARRALTMIDPEERPYDQIAALSLLVSALTNGDRADRDEAAECLAQLRATLPPRCPAIRARILWAEALLYYRDGGRKGRTRKLLDQARRRFLRRGMDAEAAAVTAELARHAPEGAVPRLCRDLLPILTPGPIRDLVEQLRRARVVDRVATAERLRRLVQDPRMLPAPR